MDSELAEDRADDVDIEDVVLRALLGEGLDGLTELVSYDLKRVQGRHTFAREMDKKQTLIIIPEMVT